MIHGRWSKTRSDGGRDSGGHGEGRWRARSSPTGSVEVIERRLCRD